MIEILLDNYSVLLSGLGLTIVISLAGIGGGSLLGLALAFALRARKRKLRLPAKLYVSFWRGTPILVQLLLIFYLLPELGIVIQPVTAAVLALALNSAAFQAEIFRSGFAALSKGQVEAAAILGLGHWRTRFRIEFPQGLRLVLPALANEAISIVKNSSLVSVIAVTELMRRSQQIASSTFQPLETYLVAALLYLAINWALAAAARRLEHRLAQSGALQT